AGVQVGVADERGEIAACSQGAPQLDVGPGADVVTGLAKARAIPLLVRAMGPQLIATDELDGLRDCAAVRRAMGCGVTVLATAHGRSRTDARSRLGSLDKAFERLVILEAVGKPPRVDASDGGEEGTCDGCWP
ncbi:MAG: stage III sporulation protein AA, partial [Firmicutes bacterium]|nr:stage III sporulation protein AA [Bacillota bacterium]